VGVIGAARVLPGSGTLRRNVLLDLVSLVGVGITASVVLSLLPGVARHQGLDPVGIAFLAAAPFAANVLGLFSNRLGPRTPRGMSLFRAGGALLLVVMVVLPIPLVMAALATGYWISLAFSNPLQQRMWGAMYPAAERGRLIGFVSTGKAAAAGMAVLAGGILADRIGGMVVVAFAGAIGALCAMAASRIQAPLDPDAPRFSAHESWAAFRRRPALRQVAAAQAFYGAGLIAAGPLYALVQVDRLSLSMAEIGLIGILGAVAATLSCLAWGSMADRRGSVSVMRIGSALGLVSIVLYAVAPSVIFLWVAAVIVGVANAATDMGLASVISEQVPQEERGAAVAGLNALTGARGMFAPFVASIAVQAGFLTVTQALLLCAATTGIGTVMYLRLMPSGAPRPWRALVPSLPRTAGLDRGLRRARALVVAVTANL
jgi:MFS family permease